jgi:hypothetical protein
MVVGMGYHIRVIIVTFNDDEIPDAGALRQVKLGWAATSRMTKKAGKYR